MLFTFLAFLISAPEVTATDGKFRRRCYKEPVQFFFPFRSNFNYISFFFLFLGSGMTTTHGKFDIDIKKNWFCSIVY